MKIPLLKQVQKLDVCARDDERTLVPEKVKVAAIKIEFYFNTTIPSYRIENFLLGRAFYIDEHTHTSNILPDYFFIAHRLAYREKAKLRECNSSSSSSSFFYRWHRGIYANGRYRMYILYMSVISISLCMNRK